MASGSGMKYGFWIQIRFLAQQIAVWCRIFTAGAEPSGFTYAAWTAISPARSRRGNTASPMNSSPVCPTQFSLNAACTLWTTGPRSRTLTSAKCSLSSAFPSQASTMQWPPSNATRPSSTTSFRWSRSPITPRLRMCHLWNLTSLQPESSSCCSVDLPIFFDPTASSRTRTVTPARLWRRARQHALAQHAFLPQEALEVHRALCSCNLFDQDVEEGAVLEHLDAVALYRRAESKTRQ